MLELLITCSLTYPFLTPDIISDYKECKEIEYKIQSVEQHIELIVEEFGIDKALTPLLIIYCESSGRPNAVNTNRDNSTDVGLFQFWDNTWLWLKNKLNIEGNRKTPSVNIKTASWLYYNSGSHHWNSSKDCWYEQ